MPDRERNALRNLDAPWITKKGYIDLGKFPIEPILTQSLQENPEEYRSAYRVLASMYTAGKTEAAVFLYGLLTFYRNDTVRKEAIINVLWEIKTAEAADLLFRELNQTESSNSTRVYIKAILRSLSNLPPNLVAVGCNALLRDSKWSYRMKRKFREILERDALEY